MGRKATEVKPMPAPPVLNEAKFEEVTRATNELAHFQADQAERAMLVARQVGYDGSMTVGALEDEIRFYQRRTVEAILETGKRLVVLKELTPHGEFAARVGLLGFSDRTARRFMQASIKTSKSAILADLSKQSKNGQAFLELITHDDDVLEGLQEMDDFDRLSASQLRERARELQADLVATEKVMATKDAKINAYARKASKFSFTEDWPEQVNAAATMVDQVSKSIEVSLDIVIQTCQQALAAMPPDEAQREHHERGMAVLAARVRDAMARQALVQRRVDEHFAATLGHFLAD